MPDELKGILRRRPSGGWPPQTDSTGGRPDRHVRFAEPVAEEKVESNLDSKLARLGGERIGVGGGGGSSIGWRVCLPPRPSNEGQPNLNPSDGAFPTSIFADAVSILTGQMNMQRQPSAQMSQQQQVNNTATNGVGPAMNGMAGMPINPGQQMDVNMVYQKLMELSEVLKENRERTQGIVAGAEELATRAAANGASPTLQEANAEVSAARIADLTRQVNKLEKMKQILLREQRENTKLIGEYETALGNICEMIRDFSYNKDMEKHSQARDYNKLLQDEKDAHLATRLEKDEWHAKYIRACEMLRHAYKLRCEEDEVPSGIVAGLQFEVRSFRNALGMEPEKFEDETGYPILKDIENGAGEP